MQQQSLQSTLINNSVQSTVPSNSHYRAPTQQLSVESTHQQSLYRTYPKTFTVLHTTHQQTAQSSYPTTITVEGPTQQQSLQSIVLNNSHYRALYQTNVTVQSSLFNSCHYRALHQRTVTKEQHNQKVSIKTAQNYINYRAPTQKQLLQSTLPKNIHY